MTDIGERTPYFTFFYGIDTKIFSLLLAKFWEENKYLDGVIFVCNPQTFRQNHPLVNQFQSARTLKVWSMMDRTGLAVLCPMVMARYLKTRRNSL